jgi:hypothetical protein
MSANPIKLLNDFAIVLELLHKSVLQQQAVPSKPLWWTDLHLFLVHKPDVAGERTKADLCISNDLNF